MLCVCLCVCVCARACTIRLVRPCGKVSASEACCAAAWPSRTMYASQAGRAMPGVRDRSVGDVLEQIKIEFSQLAEESNACQRQRDEYQLKCASFALPFTPTAPCRASYRGPAVHVHVCARVCVCVHARTHVRFIAFALRKFTCVRVSVVASGCCCVRVSIAVCIVVKWRALTPQKHHTPQPKQGSNKSRK